MPQNPHKIVQYRKRAMEIRKLAIAISDRVAAQELLKVADEYETLAIEIERSWQQSSRPHDA